jgi:phytoene/squalene synthetase
MVADLIGHDRSDNPGLRSFITRFLAVIEFDAHRRGHLISQQELSWYSSCLGEAVTDGIQYFIGNRHPHLTSPNRYLGATAAHIAHMLRDLIADVADGYINIPREYLEEHGIDPNQVTSPALRTWVRSRVDLARAYFREGKACLDELVVLRRKIAGYWYAARYEGVLDAIERDDYVLRAEYSERRRLSAWIRIALLGASITLRHVAMMPRRERHGAD